MSSREITGTVNGRRLEIDYIEAIRKRPAMYLGSTNLFGLIAYLVQPVSILLNLGAKRLDVRVSDAYEVHADVRLDIADTGAAARRFQRMGDGDWFETPSGTLLNALSDSLSITVNGPDACREIRFAQGRFVDLVERPPNSTDAGTVMRLRPDPTILTITEAWPALFESYLRRLSYLHDGVRLSVSIGDEVKTYCAPNGIADLFTAFTSPLQIMHRPIDIIGERDSLRMRAVFAFQSWENNAIHYFVNGGRTVEKGTHETGFLRGLSRLKKTLGLGKDFRNGVAAVVSIHHPNIRFSGCIRSIVDNEDFPVLVAGLLVDETLRWLKDNPDVAAQLPIVERFQFPEMM